MSHPLNVNVLTPKTRRPKPGFGFALIRLAGWILGIVGGLLSVAAMIGFIAMLPKIIPVIADTWQYLPEDKMAGLVIIASLAWLFVFVLLGLGGLVSVGIAFIFNRWGTEPTVAEIV